MSLTEANLKNLRILAERAARFLAVVKFPGKDWADLKVRTTEYLRGGCENC